MSNNAIGTGAIIITANADAVASGLSKVGDTASKWASGFTSKIAGVFSGGASIAAIGGALGGTIGGAVGNIAGAAKGAMTAAGGIIGTYFGGPIGTAIGTAVGAGLGNIGELAADVIGEPFAKLKVFAGINKQASTLGIAASQFQGLSKVLNRAGIEGDAVSSTFATMGKNIADASQGHGKAFPALEALGIDAKALMALPIDKQFEGIADAIAKLPPGAEQASAALHIFGGQGAALLPELQKGGAGIQAFIEQQKRFGTVLGDEQYKAAGKASAAWKASQATIAAAWEGLSNRAAIMFAPAIEFAGKAVSKVFAYIAPVFDWFGQLTNKVSAVMGPVFDELSGWFAETVDWLGQVAQGVIGFGNQFPPMGDIVNGVFRGIGVVGAWLYDSARVWAGGWAIGLSIVIDVYAGIQRIMLGVLRLGAMMPGALGRGFKVAADGAAQIIGTEQRFASAIRKWGADGIANFGSSAKKVNDFFNRPLKVESVADAKTVGAPVVSTPQSDQYAAAILRNSKEDYALEIRNRYGSDASSDRDPARQQVAQQKISNDELRGIRRSLELNRGNRQTLEVV